MLRKPRQIHFDENMERDLQEIKNQFHQKFGIMPSNTEVMNLLLKTFKEINTEMKQKPRRPKEFSIKLI